MRAAERGLALLRRLARKKSTFATYSGHFLLAFYFIGTTSRHPALRRAALGAGRERARYWMRHYRTPPHDAEQLIAEICASHAAAKLGIPNRRIHRDLEGAAARYSLEELLGFDPRRGRIPRRRPYQAWYCALISIYFCEQFGLSLPVSFKDVMRLLPKLRPYPRPDSPHYYDAIYAVTHIVYTLNGYNATRVLPPRLRRERAFLKGSLAWALKQGEADTVAEIVDSLAGCGVDDSDERMIAGRAFILAQQRADGGWGDEDDEYGRFHSVWTCIDGLRDYAWRGRRAISKRPALSEITFRRNVIESNGPGSSRARR